MNEVLCQFFEDCGRAGCLEGIFIATEDQVKEAYGKNAYFDDVLGKHSEYLVTLTEENLTIKSGDKILINNLKFIFNGNNLCGLNPLENLESDL